MTKEQFRAHTLITPLAKLIVEELVRLPGGVRTSKEVGLLLGCASSAVAEEMPRLRGRGIVESHLNGVHLPLASIVLSPTFKSAYLKDPTPAKKASI